MVLLLSARSINRGRSLAVKYSDNSNMNIIQRWAGNVNMSRVQFLCFSHTRPLGPPFKRKQTELNNSIFSLVQMTSIIY